MDTASLKILLITDDTAYCLSARKALERAERRFSVTAVESLAAAGNRLAELTPDLVLADERLPDGSGLELLNKTGHEPPWPVVILLPRASERRAAAVMKAGAIDYIIKSRKRLGDLPHMILSAHREWVRILEQRKAETALRASQEKYRELVESANSIILRWRPTGEITFFNEFALRFFGYRLEEILGKSIVGTIVPEQESSGRDLAAMVQGIVDNPDLYVNNENENICKDGKRIWVAWTNKALADEQGNIREILCIGNDITERKIAEKKLREQAEETTWLLKSMLNAFVLFESVFDGSGTFVSYRFLYINNAYEKITGVQSSDVLGKTVHEVWPETEQSWIFMYGSVAVTGETRTFDMYHKPTQKMYHCNVYRPWETPDRFCVIFEDITERLTAEAVLRESEEKFKSLAENINIGIFRTSVEEGGRIIYANQALAKIYGADSLEEMFTLRIVDIYWNPEDRAAVLNDLFLKGQVRSHEILLKNKKGEPVWCAINARLQYSADGRPVWIDGAIENINERKRMEQALRESEALVRSIFETDPTGVCFTINRTFMRANRRFCEMIGYTENELIGQSVRMAYPDDEEFYRAGKELYNSLEAYGIGTVESRLKRKDGGILDVLISIAPLDPQNRSAGFTTVVLDVTERNRAEAQRRESEQRLADIIDFLPDATFVIDNQGKVIAWNRAIEEMTGVPKAEIIGKNNYAYAVPFYGEPRPILIDLVFLEGDEIERKYRFVTRRDKNIVGEAFTPALHGGKGAYLWGTASPLFDSTGALVGAIECIRDISERKQATDALVASEQKLYSILQGSPIPKFVIDNEHRVLYWNSALEVMSGIPAVDMLQTGQHWKAFYREQRPCLADLLIDGTEDIIASWYGDRCRKSSLVQEAYEGTDFFPDLSGGGRWLHFTAAPIRDVSGNLIGAVETLEDITASRRAQQELIESRERLDLALKAASLGMWDWYIDTGKLVLNERWANILGYRLSELSPNFAAFEKMIHPDDASGVLKALQEHLEGKTPSYQSEHRLLTKSGDWRWVLDCGRVVERDATGNPLRATGIVLDTNIRKIAVEQLRFAYDELREREEELQQANRDLNDINLKLKESEQSLAMAIDISRASIWEYDVKTGQTHIKRYPWESGLGYSIEELAIKGEAFRELYHPDSWRKVQDTLAAYLRGETDTFETEIRMRSKSGDWVWSYVLGKASEYASDGAPQKLLGVAIDITPLKKAQEEVKAAQEQLMQADKLVALGTLVAGVAHEINNPNNFVMLNTPLIQEIWKGLLPVLEQYYREQGDFKAGGMIYSKVREAVPTLLNGILDGARRISSIVKELKDFARPDDVSMNQKVDINAAVQAAVSLLHNAVKKATSSFTVTYGENLPPVPGNTQRLEQVFINLILNACQALPDNTRAIQVTTESDGDSIAVTVKDEGKGIPREYLNQIMDPFFTTKRGAGGTGLGLSISRKIIDDHKGRIDVQSRVGMGTTFTVLLPVQRVEEVKRILIADDEESMREIMYNTLSRNPSYEVRTVENGTAACIMLGKWRPDLIVLDINMPDMNGVEVCRRIKSDPDFANTKVIICTGHPDSREMRDIREMGFADMLPKPFLNRELQAVIAAALASKENMS